MSTISLIQNQMNAALKNRSYKKAYSLFVYFNELRQEAGMAFFTMPNLQARFNDTRKDF